MEAKKSPSGERGRERRGGNLISHKEEEDDMVD